MDNPLTVWNPSDLVVIPDEVSIPSDVVEYGKATLSIKDRKSISSGFASGSYEMVSAFVWIKASVNLKKQIASLGMEFVGEMLHRPDLDEDSDPTTAIGDHEVISLAEDLGMVTQTQALRLKNAMQLVNHFANLDQRQADEEQMQREEAASILRTCITSVLGKPQFEAAIRFTDFRNALAKTTLKAGDGDVDALVRSPYFFLRTTLSVLLAMVKDKGADGASFEHAVGNTMLLIPKLWERLRDTEKWQIGQAYAEVMAQGNRPAAAGLRKALQDIHGFDFVPESLRSNTFTEVAARVLAAHYGFNNFFKEEEPMETLANLGTTIPMPAFSKCMEATLAVWIGNRYGRSWAASAHAKALLDGLRPTQWEYYFDQCLPRDRTILDKLCDEENQVSRWRTLWDFESVKDAKSRNKDVADLIRMSANGKVQSAAIIEKAKLIRANAGK